MRLRDDPMSFGDKKLQDNSVCCGPVENRVVLGIGLEQVI